MEAKSNNKVRLTDAILLAALPPYVYLVAFVYEYAYCSNFAIPKSLITPSLTTILVFASAIGALLLSSFKFLGFTTPLFRVLTEKKKSSYHGLVGVNAIFLVVLILILHIYPFSWTLLLTILIAFVVVDLIYFGIPVLVALKKKKTIEQGLDEAGQDEDKFDLLVFFTRNLSRRETGIILLLLGMIALSYMIGDGEARKQTTFPTLATRPNTAILRIYGDLLICAEYDPSSKTVSDSLLLMRTSYSSETVLIVKEIGPLRRAARVTDPAQAPTTHLKSSQIDSSSSMDADSVQSNKKQ